MNFAIIFLIPTFTVTQSQIYNKDFYLNRYLDSTMGNSGYYRPVYPGQTAAAASTLDYYPTAYSHPYSQASFYHHPRDLGIYEYPYHSPMMRSGYDNYGGGRMAPYGGYYGGNDYGYMNDQPGMFRGALDGAIKGTIAGAFGL